MRWQTTVFLAGALLGAFLAGPRPWLGLIMRWEGCHSVSLSEGSLRIALYDSGETDLPPVVLVHGFLAGGGLSWMRVVPRLKGRCRVIIPDLLNGSGDNVLQPGYRLAREVDVLEAVLRHLRLERPLLVFFSLNCLVAPSFHGKADVVCLAPPPPCRVCLERDMDALFGRPCSWFVSSLFYRAPPGFALAVPVLYRRWKPHFPFLRSLAFFETERWEAFWTDAADTAVLIPDDDRFFPSTRACATSGPGTPIRVVLPRSGHAAPWDAPDALAEFLLQRLTEHVFLSSER